MPKLAQALQDAFEDAVLMGVDEQAMRRILSGMVDGLESPKRRGSMRLLLAMIAVVAFPVAAWAQTAGTIVASRCRHQLC